MPLCNTEVEEATEDDLIEFSKIQTLNLGQVPFASSTFSFICFSQAAATDLVGYFYRTCRHFI
jgi:hypothetical protein